MAGEWIKMRTNLWDDPRVSSLCDLTGQPEAMVVGGLYWLWAMADEHTEDGYLPGLTLRAISRKTGVVGLGEAMVQIGWIEVSGDGVRVVNFAEHNGASAKRRSMEAKRKSSVRKVSACDADKKRKGSGARVREENIKPSHTPREEPLADSQAPPDPDIPGPDSPVAMNLDWQPNPDDLKAYAMRAGVPLDAFTPEAVSPFVLHHESRGQARTRREWTADLVRWVQRDRVRDARVVQLRAGQAGSFDDTDISWMGDAK